MTGTRWARRPAVVWRLGPDRVLVRHVGATGDDAAADLLGAAAAVWLALDEPGTLDEVRARLADVLDDDADGGLHGTLDDLVSAGWLVGAAT